MLISARRRLQEFGLAARSAGGDSDRLTLTHLALLVAAVLALFVFARTVEAVLDLHTSLPYYDQWATVTDYDRLREGSYGLDDLVTQHNEHRPVVPRLVIFADLHFFGGQGHLLSALNVFLQLVAAAALAAAAFFLFRGRRGGSTLLVLSCALSLALQFTTAQIETFILPFQVLWTVGYTAGTASIAALVASTRPARRRWRVALLVLAVALAAVSQFSVAQGGLAWLILLALGYWRRMPRGWLITIAVVAAASLAAFFFGYDRAADVENPVESLARPDRLLDFIFVAMGGPLLPLFDRWAARVLGFAGAVAAAAIIANAARRRDSRPAPEAFLLGQLGFSALAIIAIAFVRSPLGVSTAEAPRYAMLAGAFWTSIIILGLHMAPALRFSIRIERVAMAVAALFIVTAAVSPWRALGPWEDVFHDLEGTSDAIRTGVYDDTAIVRIYPEPGDIKASIPILEEYNLSVFRGDHLSPLLDTPLADHFGVAPGICMGFFDVAVAARGSGGAAVSGWAWDPAAGRRPAEVLIVGPDGLVRGFATARADRIDVLSTVPGITSLQTGWFGYSRATGGPARAYAVVAVGVACPLDGEHEIVALP